MLYLHTNINTYLDLVVGLLYLDLVVLSPGQRDCLWFRLDGHGPTLHVVLFSQTSPIFSLLRSNACDITLLAKLHVNAYNMLPWTQSCVESVNAHFDWAHFAWCIQHGSQRCCLLQVLEWNTSLRVYKLVILCGRLPDTMGTLEVWVENALNVPNVETFGKSDPYVQVEFQGRLG